LFKSSYGSLLLTVGFMIIMMFMNMLQTIAQYNPLQLMSVNMALLTNTMVPSDLYISLSITAILSVITLISSILIFNKKQI
ncbi:MAG: hypothetical protein RR558_09130, partial [Coprobacillus sp.]